MIKTQRISSFFLSLAAACMTFGIAAAPAAVHAAAVKKPVVTAKSKIVAKKKVAKRVSVSAIKGKDEKDFAVSTSRCLTKEMTALHAASVKRMEADIAKAGIGFEAPAATYRSNIETIWSAMAEPYCGYGSQGVNAVKRSYQKSVERTRATFLAAVKKQ